MEPGCARDPRSPTGSGRRRVVARTPACWTGRVTRLRQLVLAAHERAPVQQALQGLLAASSPHYDPDVGRFGLTIAVLAAGCDFVEVVSPSVPGTAAGRWLARNGSDG